MLSRITSISFIFSCTYLVLLSGCGDKNHSEKEYSNTPSRLHSPTTSNIYPKRTSLSSGCESGHWVQEVLNDGEIVILEDGSVWQVDLVDAIDSSLWLPTSDIIACEDKLINTDDNESVDATRIR